MGPPAGVPFTVHSARHVGGCDLICLDSADMCAQRSKLADDILVAALDIVRIFDDGGAVEVTLNSSTARRLSPMLDDTDTVV